MTVLDSHRITGLTQACKKHDSGQPVMYRDIIEGFFRRGEKKRYIVLIIRLAVYNR